MIKKNFKSIIIFTLIVFTGCTNTINNNPTISPSPTSSSQKTSTETSPTAVPDNIENNITFNISIDKKYLSENFPLTINIYNQEQINQLKQNKEGNKEQIKINPESFSFTPKQFTDETIIVKSNKLKLNENYEIHFDGISSDNCNPTSAVVTGLLNEENINIKNLEWLGSKSSCSEPNNIEYIMITGTVKSKDGSEISDASVSIKSADNKDIFPLPQQDKTISGIYVFRNIPVGIKVEISVSKVGWKTQKREVITQSNYNKDSNVFDFTDEYALEQE